MKLRFGLVIGKITTTLFQDDMEVASPIRLSSEVCTWKILEKESSFHALF